MAIVQLQQPSQSNLWLFYGFVKIDSFCEIFKAVWVLILVILGIFRKPEQASLKPAAARWSSGSFNPLETSLRATPDVTILPPLATNTSFAGPRLSDQNPMLLAPS